MDVWIAGALRAGEREHPRFDVRRCDRRRKIAAGAPPSDGDRNICHSRSDIKQGEGVCAGRNELRQLIQNGGGSAEPAVGAPYVPKIRVQLGGGKSVAVHELGRIGPPRPLPFEETGGMEVASC